MQKLNVTAQSINAATPMQTTAAAATSLAAHDSHPRDIQAAFSQGGILIRTVQKKHAHQELHNCDVDLAQVRQLHAGGTETHGGLRKWSLGHAELCPNYFMMGVGSQFDRHMAFLALPEKVGAHVVGIHECDASSGNPTDTTVMTPQDARLGLNGLLGKLKNNQREKPDAPLINNEVQTVGVAPQAIAGMLFHPSAKAKTWEAARSDFQNAINAGGAEFAGRTFPIFSYAVDERTGRTELRLLDSLSKQN